MIARLCELSGGCSGSGDESGRKFPFDPGSTSAWERGYISVCCESVIQATDVRMEVGRQFTSVSAFIPVTPRSLSRRARSDTMTAKRLDLFAEYKHACMELSVGRHNFCPLLSGTEAAIVEGIDLCDWWGAIACTPHQISVRAGAGEDPIRPRHVTRPARRGGAIWQRDLNNTTPGFFLSQDDMWSTGGQVLSLVLTAVAVILVPSADCSVPPPEIQDEVNKCMLTLGLHKVIPHISSVKMAMDFCMAKVARAQSDGFQRTVKNSYQSPSSYSQQQSPYSNSQQSSFPQQSSQAAYMTNAISPYVDSGAANKQFDPKTYDGVIEECSEKSFLAGKCVEMTDWLVNMVTTVAAAVRGATSGTADRKIKSAELWGVTSGFTCRNDMEQSGAGLYSRAHQLSGITVFTSEKDDRFISIDAKSTTESSCGVVWRSDDATTMSSYFAG
ncbi:hypothetical protein Bbelb_129260 [Branchiostoma belcheri]|nr:hypothetical protein Bbelb_129260 [Branchiostoma belcheri]